VPPSPPLSHHIPPKQAQPSTPPIYTKCYKCGSIITIQSSERPLMIQCTNCGAKGMLT
jgi:ribosomal protein S27E